MIIQVAASAGEQRPQQDEQIVAVLDMEAQVQQDGQELLQQGSLAQQDGGSEKAFSKCHYLFNRPAHSAGPGH